MSTRRTRNNPSPSGLRSLPYGPVEDGRKKKPARKAKTVTPVAAPTAAHLDEGSTSRSASPQLMESHSDSPPPVAESRSTSPPTYQPPTSQTPNISTTDQQPDPKPSKKAPTKKRLRATKKGNAGRPAKRVLRSRRNNAPAEDQQEEDDDASDADDDGDEAHNSPQPKPIVLSIPASYPEEHTSEEETVAPRLEETQKSPGASLRERRFLTPKPNRPKAAKQAVPNTVHSMSLVPRDSEPVPAAMKSRAALFEEIFGEKMPKHNRPGLRNIMKQGADYFGPRRATETEYIDPEEGSDGEFDFLDAPAFTKSQMAKLKNVPKTFRRDQIPFELPQFTDNHESRRKLARASKPRPNAARSLAAWAERDETRRVPTAEQMEALLDAFHAQESAKVAAPSTPAPSTPPALPQPSAELNPVPVSSHEDDAQHEALEAESDSSEHELDEMSGALGVPEDPSEVQSEIQEPQTPANQTVPQLQQSRGFWSGVSAVKSMLATPFQFLGSRNQQDGQAAATNGDSVTGASTFTQPRNNSGSINSTNGPTTPTRPGLRRKKTSQSERKSRAPSTHSKHPQTERRRRLREEPKPPIHLRGLLSPTRIAEIHREQDRLAEERNKKRQAHAARVEDEEEAILATPSTNPARAGEKRKRRTPPPPGTFRVPSPGSSDDSDEDEVIGSRPARTGETSAADMRQVPFEECPTSFFDRPLAKPAPLEQSFFDTPPGYDDRSNPFLKSPTPSSNRSSTFQSFKTPGYDGSDSDDDDDGADDHGAKKSNEREQNEREQNMNQTSESSVLQPKQWTQTPPPKPRPGNALLPATAQQLSAAELAKAKAEKFKPKQPSGLRNVTQMSPMQMDKENIKVMDSFTSHPNFDKILADSGVDRQEWDDVSRRCDLMHQRLDPEVKAYVNNIPDHEIAKYPLPPYLSDALERAKGKQSDVDMEVEKYFT
ncbi:hypothetical protein M430DRAFT_33077 [Amorphotheca resinae ATCC 22711]|uniref:Uncharacterized protein n=1 Tax=Amorphotheca resinae ATCC 22711 TaxID=857342 RepID=A0A2T3BAL7_AMORE|nr:hypothetical protein M430DRAFT_33077 [Amorphotheca resinae ATCC 22711]PSS25319.1 hypothetical protein M430DRAFT_33077 [Amorphotheca resinae ATCC 22711]